MGKLLEKAGHSFSGISDIIHNQPELEKELVFEMVDKWDSLEEEIQKIESKLGKLKNSLCLVSGSMSIYLKAKKVDNINFIKGENSILIQQHSGGLTMNSNKITKL